MNSRSRTRCPVRLAGVVAALCIVLANIIVPAGPRPTAAVATLSAGIGRTGGLAGEDTARLRGVLNGAQTPFIENLGQIDSRVRYYVQGRDATIYFTSQGLTISLTGKGGGHSDRDRRADAGRPPNPVAQAEQFHREQRWTVKLDFLGCNRHVHPVPQDRAATVISYFQGPRHQWKTGLRSYSTLLYRNLWPGIDLLYTGTGNRLKYEFVVKPGADPSHIKLAYRGATEVKLDQAGNLEVVTPVQSFQDNRPVSHQEINGKQVEIATSFNLNAKQIRSPQSSNPDRNVYGFRVGEYDRGRTMVLDPSIIVYSGLIGGSNNDTAFHVAVDPAGNAYIAGLTTSSPSEGFPVSAGPNLNFTPDRANGPIGSRLLGAYVAKLKADGSGFAYCGYIGGAGNQVATGIAVDSAGRAYVCGATDSKPSQGFPITVGPKLTYGGGSFTAGGINDALLGDAFVARVNAAGTGLDYCGYIGGEGDDFAYGVAVDSTGAAYVTGQTSSTQTFPLSVGPSLAYGGDPYDAFLAKVKPDGSGFAYCGYIGGGATDIGFGVAVDSTASAYVTGVTTSDPASLHVAVGPKLTRSCSDAAGKCPDYDAFVAKVKPDGSGFNYLGFIGGAENDGGIAVAVDGSGNAYVTGGTASNASSFPVVGGPGLTLRGVGDAFLAKVKADGTGLVYNGYIGGSGIDAGTGIALDSAGNAYVVGYTQSSDLAVTDGSTFKGGGTMGDAFVAKVKADGTGLLHLGYFGGSDDDWGLSIALDPSGSAYICGASFSTDFPVVVGPVLTAKGGQDGFVAKLSGIGTPPQPDFSLSFDQPSVTGQVGTKARITININRINGLTGNVTVTPPPPSGGIKAKPPDPITTTDNSASFKMKIGGGVAPGSYQLTFTAADDSGKLMHAATVTLVVVP